MTVRILRAFWGLPNMAQAHLVNVVENLREQGVANATHHVIGAMSRAKGTDYFDNLFAAIMNLTTLYNAYANGVDFSSDGVIDLTATGQAADGADGPPEGGTVH